MKNDFNPEENLFEPVDPQEYERIVSRQQQESQRLMLRQIQQELERIRQEQRLERRLSRLFYLFIKLDNSINFFYLQQLNPLADEDQFTITRLDVNAAYSDFIRSNVHECPNKMMKLAFAQLFMAVQTDPEVKTMIIHRNDGLVPAPSPIHIPIHRILYGFLPIPLQKIPFQEAIREFLVDGTLNRQSPSELSHGAILQHAQVILINDSHFPNG